MTTYPMYSENDRLAPYLGYSAVVRVVVGGGTVQMPLAYRAASGASRPTARLIQVAEPTVVVRVDWKGIRTTLKPEPPKVTTLGSFVLAQAGGQCSGPGKDASGNDVFEAAGFLVLYTSDRPETLELPALWFPWDGRYGTSAIQWAYTPAELGFGAYLPGVPATPTKINNPPPTSTGAGNKLRI